ncbi:hypothetical protein CR513_30137, partial [Mucuna pruriens]
MLHLPAVLMDDDSFLPQQEKDATRLDEATEKSIHWYPQWNERKDAIIKYGGFPNVPLMGTQGAINYNPELTIKQAGYPMVLPLTERVVAPFIIHGIRMQNGEYLKKIRHAWSETKP